MEIIEKYNMIRGRNQAVLFDAKRITVSIEGHPGVRAEISKKEAYRLEDDSPNLVVGWFDKDNLHAFIG